MVHTGTSILQQYAAVAREEIEAALDALTAFGPGCPDPLTAAIRHSLLAPCKRLRPLLVLMSAEACGCTREAAMPAACAVELVHTYSLIHDDLPTMDDDDVRRGRATCHVAFDEATAILAGDALLALAFEVLATRVEPPSVAANCCGELARAAGPTALVGGQMDDLYSNRAQLASCGPDASTQDDEMGESDWSTDGKPGVDRDPGVEGGVSARQQLLQSIHTRKTGALFHTSVRLGGLIAQADDELLTRLDTYGQKVGFAFQIADDLLDARGDAEIVGKAVGKDIDRGKLTFPGIWGIDESVCRAEELVSAACAALAPLGQRAECLDALARYIMERNH